MFVSNIVHLMSRSLTPSEFVWEPALPDCMYRLLILLIPPIWCQFWNIPLLQEFGGDAAFRDWSTLSAPRPPVRITSRITNRLLIQSYTIHTFCLSDCSLISSCYIYQASGWPVQVAASKGLYPSLPLHFVTSFSWIFWTVFWRCCHTALSGQ